MPPKDRLRRDEEGCPSLTRDEVSEGADERSVRPGETRTGDLALEDGELVVQHEDLGVFSYSVQLVDADCFGEAANEAVEEGERHEQRA
jgi:hypothetical protein